MSDQNVDTSNSNSGSNGADVCYRCKQSGHMASKCPTKKKNGGIGLVDTNSTTVSSVPSSSSSLPPSSSTESNSASSASDICFRCKQSGHRASACPTKKKNGGNGIIPTENEKPSTANENELITRPAKSKVVRGGPDDQTCYKCRKNGHVSKDCPLKLKPRPIKTPVTTSSSSNHSRPSSSRPPSSSSSSSSSTSSTSTSNETWTCNRCGSAEHLAKDCPEIKTCYVCGSQAHISKYCPKKSKIEAQQAAAASSSSSSTSPSVPSAPKPCFHCSSTDHIARECPSLGHRTIYRDETKPRGKECYVCDKEGHHAIECPELETLQKAFDLLIATTKQELNQSSTSSSPSSSTSTNPAPLTSEQYLSLLQRCVKALEYKGALFLYQHMLYHNVTISPEFYSTLEQLHDKAGKDMSQVKGLDEFLNKDSILAIATTTITTNKKKTLNPKTAIKNIITAHRSLNRSTQITSRLTTIITYLSKLNNDTLIKLTNRFEVCKLLVLQCGVSAKDARELVQKLKENGIMKEKNKLIEWKWDGNNNEGEENNEKKKTNNKKKKKKTIKKKKIENKSSEEGNKEITTNSEKDSNKVDQPVDDGSMEDNSSITSTLSKKKEVKKKEKKNSKKEENSNDGVDPLSDITYQDVINAYEILSKPAYDDLLANPEAYYRHLSMVAKESNGTIKKVSKSDKKRKNEETEQEQLPMKNESQSAMNGNHNSSNGHSSSSSNGEVCHRCKQPGHYASKCPMPKKIKTAH